MLSRGSIEPESVLPAVATTGDSQRLDDRVVRMATAIYDRAGIVGAG